MSDPKKINDFVDNEIESFFDDLNDNKKKLRLFTIFDKSNINYEKIEISIDETKRSNKSIVKIKTKVNNNSNIIF